MNSPQYIDNDKYERLITIGEAASLLDIVPKTLREYARRGQIPAYKFGGSKGHWRVKMSEVYDSMVKTGADNNNVVINSWKGLAGE